MADGDVPDWMRTLRLVPEWFGGDLIPDTVPLSPELRARLRAWNRIWESVLDPVEKIEWPDPEVGRQWIEEGERLVRDLQAELGPSIVVVEGFAAYAPNP